MQYALLLKSHANIRYVQSLQKLALAELRCILQAWDIKAEVLVEKIAGTDFLTFRAESLEEEAWEEISRHSAICFAAGVENGLLRPLHLFREGYLPNDLAEVLKYKGKTNVDFTLAALHCAKAASAFAKSRQPLMILDPVCGRGTALFCAVQEGHNTVGIDLDTKGLAEADAYFARYLKYHMKKHHREMKSLTLPKGKSVKETVYTFADTSKNYQAGDRRTLRLLNGDTRNTGEMLGKKSCHILLADLPYGVQHVSQKDGKLTAIQNMLAEAISGYAGILKKGGAMALSFNTFTVKRMEVENILRSAGLTVLTEEPYGDFSHWVEQAVNRDLVIARQDG